MVVASIVVHVQSHSHSRLHFCRGDSLCFVRCAVGGAQKKQALRETVPLTCHSGIYRMRCKGRRLTVEPDARHAAGDLGGDPGSQARGSGCLSPLRLSTQAVV